MGRQVGAEKQMNRLVLSKALVGLHFWNDVWMVLVNVAVAVAVDDDDDTEDVVENVDRFFRLLLLPVDDLFVCFFLDSWRISGDTLLSPSNDWNVLPLSVFRSV